MNRADQYKEQLSALMDGELSAEELKSLLNEFERQPELRQQWSDHHAVRQTLFEKRQRSTAHASMAHQISAAIEKEPTTLAPIAKQPVQTVKRPWIPLALAASLATVTFLVLQPQLQSEVGQQMAQAPVETEWVEVDGNWVERWVNPLDQVDQGARVRSYLVRHDEQRNSARETASLVSTAPGAQATDQRSVTKRIVGWQIGWLPEGFRKVDTLHHQIPEFGGDVAHMVLSNGDAVFSVFIEKSSSKGESQRQMQGEQQPVNLYSHSTLGHRITVLGEVSMEVVRKVARSVEAQSG